MNTSVSFHATATHDESLQRAAEIFGLEPSFWDIWGNQHHASREAIQAILISLGLPAHDHKALDRAVEQRLLREWSCPVPATLVISENQPAVLPIAMPEDRVGTVIEYEVQWEEGGTEPLQADLDKVQPVAKAYLRARCWVRKPVPLPRLRLGYHTVKVQMEGATHHCRLIVCPQRAYLPPNLQSGGKAGGVAISLYGLRSAQNWGCGDCTDLQTFLDWTKDYASGSFAALNPLHSIPNRQPYNTSPYLPNSTFTRNPLYIDVQAVPEWGRTPDVQRWFALPETQQEITALREAQSVEYERVFKLKLHALRLLFGTFQREELAKRTQAADEFQEFVSQGGSLLRQYAVYCALYDWLHAQHPDLWLWTDWPAEYQDPSSDAVQEFARTHADDIQFHCYLQWVLDRQLAAAQELARKRGMPIGVYHDLALATDRFGSDLWAHRGFYVEGCRVGAPPDGFSPKGQDWSFPPPNTQRHMEDGYRLFAESIRRNCRHGGALRLDHVMRFFRLYWIPDGMDATQGVYVQDRADELLGILALESVRNKFVVIGEDLGTVAPSVRETLARFGILSYRLLYFERDSNGVYHAPSRYPKQALVSVSTHDLPTLAGFWNSRDIVARKDAGLLPDDGSLQRMLAEREAEKQRLLDTLHGLSLLPDGFPRQAAQVPEFTPELHYAAVGFLADTPSMLMVLNQEDLFNDPEQQNLPGSTEQYPNWRHKMRYTLEELTRDPEALGCARMLRHWFERSGRAL